MADLGLFSAPEDIQRARFMQEAQMTPNQRLYMMGAQAGQQVGKGVGSLFGVDVQDPTVARATKLRELGAKYGTTTAEALDKIAAELQQTDPQMAMQVAAKARELKLSTAKLESENALTQQRMREKQAASVEDKIFVELAKKATPKSIKAARDAGNDISLLEVNPEEKLSTYGRVLTETGLTPGTPEFQDKMKKFADAELEGASKKGQTTVYNRIEGIDKAITAVTGKAAGEEIAKLGQSVAGLSKFERAVTDVEALLPNSFTGLGSGALTQMNKVASALGVSKGEKASNTEILTNTFNNIVLPMARQLPGSLAAKELTFLLTTKPATEQEMPTIRRLMRQMLADYRADKSAYDASQKHAAANKGSYEGFDINTARYNAGRVADLTERVKSGTASLEEAMELKKLRSNQ